MRSRDPDTPDLFTLSRTTDPVTSREAAASVVDDITVIQKAVLEFAKAHPYGFTDRDLVAYFDGRYGPSTVRTRRAELVAKLMIVQRGAVKGEGEYRTYLPSRRRHIVWVAV